MIGDSTADPSKSAVHRTVPSAILKASQRELRVPSSARQYQVTAIL